MWYNEYLSMIYSQYKRNVNKIFSLAETSKVATSPAR